MKRTVLTLRKLAVLFLTAPLLQAQDPRAQMISPTPGSTLPGATATFAWSPAAGGGDYFLRIGSGPFGTDIFNAVVRVTSVTLTNIPTNGGTIYVALYTQQKGVWLEPFQYTYTAANSGGPAATTTTVDNKTVAFSNTAQNVTLTATVAASSSVNQGTVAFQVMDGANLIGTAVTSGALTTASASAIYALPAGTPPKTYTIQAKYSGGSSFQSSSGAGTLTVSPSASTVRLSAVTNSASYGTSSIAPGEIVTLFGAGIGPANLAFNAPDASNRFPASLAGTRILVNGAPAPLIYASDKQSAAIVPFEVAGQAAAQVLVEYNGTMSGPVTVSVANTMPGIFSADGSGSGLGAIQNADLSYNSPANPAAAGSIVVLYVSGLGMLNPPQPNGAIVAGPLPALSYPAAVTIGGQAATIVYAGPAPLAVAGLYQINCVVPESIASGQAPVVVTADGRQSQPNLTVAIR